MVKPFIKSEVPVLEVNIKKSSIGLYLKEDNKKLY